MVIPSLIGRRANSSSQKIAREMKVWSKVTHENVLAFLGFCFFPNISHTGSSAQLSLVSPWMKNGTAVQFARANPTVDRLPIIRGVVDGLRHLHEKNIVHGDIKGGNVFISDDGVPVLADFGLATWIENDRSLGPSHDAVTSTTTASLRGTPRWIAPELLLVETSKSSSESDVWALGCFILEFITLAMPYPYCRTDINAVSAIMQRRLPYEFSSPSPAVPSPFERYPALWPVCLRCWEHDVSRRIRVVDIVEHAALR
ncbi:kinase-like protein [Sistotremastrum niveocremeum HHB9708]|uniref:non-specific serine/threonine protein kinase n=1 Tax=Sistotremastrum niveocremeum HHB9708 TaxID=1314777 RepID=A0A164Y271_9AGAM|nr:kinase-like protein [Sistotremastrum niveocremeum HHB9708]